MRKTPLIAAAALLGVAASTIAAPAYAAGNSSNTHVSVTYEQVKVNVNGTEIVIDIGPDGKPVLQNVPKEPAKPAPSETPGPAGREETPLPATEAASLADELFKATNEFRAQNGNLPPFERDACLDKTATEKTKFLIESGTFDHGDRSPHERECETGIGENIAYMSPGDAETAAREFVFDIWANSTEGHREAMLSTEYTHIGVGIEPNKGGGFHATQHFTTRDQANQKTRHEAPPVEAPAAEPVPAVAEATGLKAEEGLTPDALSLLQSVHQKWPDLEIDGVRQDFLPDHPSGRALDIMTGGNDCAPVGQEIANWAKANAEQLGVHYVIWCGKIWNTQRADEGWRPNTGHRDHVHITVHGNSRA